MARYTTRPIEVEAFRYDGHDMLPSYTATESLPGLPDGLEWTRGRPGDAWKVSAIKARGWHANIVHPGDWVVTYPDGAREVMGPTRFKQTFKATKNAATR